MSSPGSETARRAIAATLLAGWVSLCGCSDDDSVAVSTVTAWMMAPHSTAQPLGLEDATLRQVVRVGVGGERVRLRLSNRKGATALQVDAASIGRSIDGGDAATDLVEVRFAGESEILLAPGEDAVSDAVEFRVAPLEDVTLSLFFAEPAELAATHLTAPRPAYVGRGNQTASPKLSEPTRIPGWSVVTGVEVETRSGVGAIVALGDSLTDGFGSSEPNGSWPDRLATLIGGDVAVLNAGISGNRILRQGDSFFGDSALARFDADVLGQRGVDILVFQEGINDLQAPALAPAFGDDPPSPPVDSAELIAGARQIIARARAASLKVVGGTLLPYEQLEALVEGAESERTEFNRWIRESGEFDAVIDFDAILRDAGHPRRLDPRYDSGDGLHPNDAGYQAMATAAFAVLEDLR